MFVWWEGAGENFQNLASGEKVRGRRSDWYRIAAAEILVKHFQTLLHLYFIFTQSFEKMWCPIRLVYYHFSEFSKQGWQWRDQSRKYFKSSSRQNIILWKLSVQQISQFSCWLAACQLNWTVQIQKKNFTCLSVLGEKKKTIFLHGCHSFGGNPSRWSFLFSSPVSTTMYWFCKEKFDLDHSWQ